MGDTNYTAVVEGVKMNLHYINANNFILILSGPVVVCDIANEGGSSRFVCEYMPHLRWGGCLANVINLLLSTQPYGTWGRGKHSPLLPALRASLSAKYAKFFKIWTKFFIPVTKHNLEGKLQAQLTSVQKILLVGERPHCFITSVQCHITHEMTARGWTLKENTVQY